MHEFIHSLKHASIDTLKIAPLLLVVYFLIEFLEYKKLMQFESSKLLKGRKSPIFGSLFGSLPQCGFSVVATDLYTKRFVSIGALLAVYIATSDEALPIMLSSRNGILPLLALLISKIVLGIIVGYLAVWLYPKIFKKDNKNLNDERCLQASLQVKHKNKRHIEYDIDENHYHAEESVTHNKNHKEEGEHIGCCHHDLESDKFDWLHPLLHCLKILLYILVINIIFAFIVEIVGEDKLVKFLSHSGLVQPLLAVLIGLIPNCASSVIITELYLLGGLSFGSILAGLAVNAGLGLMILFKQEKNIKEIAFILTMLIVPSLIAGYLVHFVML